MPATTNHTVLVTIREEIAKSELVSHQRKYLTWHQRSALIWLYLCPQMFPTEKGLERLKRVAVAGGVDLSAIKKWVCKKAGNARQNVPKWYNIVKNMTWDNVRKFFPKRWQNKRSHIPAELDVKQYLVPYKKFTEQQPTSLSSFIDMGPAARAGLAKKRPAMFRNMTKKTKRTRRSDAGKPRKHAVIKSAIETFVQLRWNTGDPCTRRQVRVP